MRAISPSVDVSRDSGRPVVQPQPPPEEPVGPLEASGPAWSPPSPPTPASGGATGANHHLTGGAEADVLWSRAATEGVVTGLGFWAGDPDHQYGYGALTNFGFDFSDGHPHFHSALCATNYDLYVAGACARWSAGQYVGVDGELGTGWPVAAMAPAD